MNPAPPVIKTLKSCRLCHYKSLRVYHSCLSWTMHGTPSNLDISARSCSRHFAQPHHRGKLKHEDECQIDDKYAVVNHAMRE